MKVKGFVTTSLIDYPGKISSVVFVEGCNLRCSYCHNAELLDTSESDTIPKNYIIESLLKRKNIISSVVISGGEPLIHKDIIQFVKEIKELGFIIKIDTNGFFPDTLSDIIDNNYADYIALDIKTSPGKYKELTKNGSFDSVKKSFELIHASAIDYEIRTTCLPGFVEIDDIVEIGKELGIVNRYYLQQFRNEKTLDPLFSDIVPHSIHYMQELLSAAAAFSTRSFLRGV